MQFYLKETDAVFEEVLNAKDASKVSAVAQFNQKNEKENEII